MPSKGWKIMLNFDNIPAGGFGRLVRSILIGAIMVFSQESISAQTMLNVTNFGARGDAVQFWVNTTSNSVVVTTTNLLSSADIGKAIEVFNAGVPTSPTNCQDMVATITNVVNGTNIYISQPAQATLTNTFATYGHNNQTNFQAAIAACGGSTNATINIPAGKYLFLTSAHSGVSVYSGIVLTGGGIHFVGEGINTILLSQGAWTLQGGAAWRGFLFTIHTPIINDFPVSFENLTLDGGVQQGNTSNHGFPASTQDGSGWDETHGAIELYGGAGNTFTHQTWTNVVFAHWRGEMVKSNDGSTNGNLSIFNCAFTDGNATAINIFASLNISNCVFENLFQVGEYYQAYSTNKSYFQDNFVTNITGNGFAINGAITNHSIPSFNIVSNTFYFAPTIWNGIETTPGQNIYITGNRFFNQIHPIALGVAGYQGTAINSNIVVTFNTFSNCYYAVLVEGSGANLVADDQVNSNYFSGQGGNSAFAYGYGWSTNVSFKDNIAVNSPHGLDSTLLTGQWYKDDASNLFPPYPVNDNTGQTNVLSYNRGMNFTIRTVKTNSIFVIDDSHPQQIPQGAVMVIKYAGLPPTPLSSSSLIALAPVSMTNGYSAMFQWTNGVWKLISPFSALLPPTGLEASDPKNAQ